MDLDKALTGIDRLLRSQELTFGFVGVAPSLAILYLVSNYALDTWRGGRGKRKYGGQKAREVTFAAIRSNIQTLFTCCYLTNLIHMSPQAH